MSYIVRASWMPHYYWVLETEDELQELENTLKELGEDGVTNGTVTIAEVIREYQVGEQE